MDKKFFSRITTKGIEHYEEMPASTLLMLEEAEKLGVTWEEIPSTRMLELSYGKTKKLFHPQVPSATTFNGFFIAQDKQIAKVFLKKQGITIPNGYSVLGNDSETFIKEVFDALEKPLVVKPSNGTQGQSVFTNISQFDDLLRAVKKCHVFLNTETATTVIEEMFEGNEYRILTTQNKVVGITYRKPANVVGDGEKTIEQLILEKNSDPRRFDDPNAALVKIRIDEHVEACLKEQSLTLLSTPKKGEVIFLRRNSNISTGGDSIDYTDIAHESVKEIALKTMKAFPGLLIAGIDFMTHDITQEQTEKSYVILEVNKSPGFSIHDMPYEGKNRHAAREFLNLLFPELESTAT